MYAYAKRYEASKVIVIYPYNENVEKNCIKHYKSDIETTQSVDVYIFFLDLEEMEAEMLRLERFINS